MRAPVSLATLLLCLVAFAALSAWLGPDASWDLRNYHLYNAHALLTGTLWRDIAPAQLQSFYHPALDVLGLALLRALNAHPLLLSATMAVPHAVAVWLALRLALCAMGSRFHGNDDLRFGDFFTPSMAGIAVLLGATGAAALPTLGTAMSEMVPGCLVLAALVLLCRAPVLASAPAVAGLLAGAAVGLKLTAAPYAIGLLAAVLVRAPRGAPAFVAAMGAAVLAVAGPWWWVLWRHTGNPVFPYFNQLFGSAWAPRAAMTDTRFLPHGVFDAILFPWRWAFAASRAASEPPVRDPRLLLGLAAWVVVLVDNWHPLSSFPRKRKPMVRPRLWAAWTPAFAGVTTGGICLGAPVRAVAAFWLAAFAAWEARFGILRYAGVLELLAGIPVALMLASAGRRGVPLFAALAAAVAAFTIYPDWGRATPGRLAAEVRSPPWQPGSLVVLLDPAPMAYVAVFAPAGVRFVGADSNLIHPDEGTALAIAARQAIADEAGPLWGLETPEDQPGEADRTLAAYGLAREPPCARVRSNLDHDAILACPLRRLSVPPPASAARRAPVRPAPG